MSRAFLFRLSLDCLTFALLLLGLAYWWQGNAVHEAVGTAFFLLVVAHNVFNRRWYGRIRQTRPEPRIFFNVGLTVLLLAVMIALLVTSVLISNVLSKFLPAWGGFTVRQIHTLAAYWGLVVVAVHLGLRWPLLMGVARTLFGIKAPNRLRTVALRTLVVLVAMHGIWSSSELGLGTKLAMQMTLYWWDFEQSVAGFFVHCVAVAGLVVSMTHYRLKLLQVARFAGRPLRVTAGA